MATNDSLTLSRYKLAAFLACQRRFELRYQTHLAWPTPPLSSQTAQQQQRGEQFHQLLERHFLGLTITPNTITDNVVRNWWRTFQHSNLPIKNGRSTPNHLLLPEFDLTVPLGNHQLNGRFDLLLLTDEHAAIFDWKTGKPQPESSLQHIWQTRLYLAMLTESGNALGRTISANTISLTYWYVREPDQPRTIHYSPSQHQQNWADLQAIAAQIDEQRAQTDTWPLTDDWQQCRHCPYQTYCGRQVKATDTIDIEEEEPLFDFDTITPALP